MYTRIDSLPYQSVGVHPQEPLASLRAQRTSETRWAGDDAREAGWVCE